MSGYHVYGVVTYVLLSFLLIGQTQSQGDYEDYDLMPEEMSDLGKTPMDIVFVVDTSTFTNMTLNLEEQVKEFMTSFINDADVDSGAVKVALVTYSTHPNLVFNLNDFSTKEDVINEIFGADFAEGERNTADVLSFVRNMLIRGRPMVPKVVLLLQTGQSDRNGDRTLQEADALKYARANIFVVGFKMDDSAMEEAKSIASRPVTENTLFINSEEEFDFAKDLVFAQIFIRAAQTLNSPAAGSERLDVVFLVHFSNTMKKQTFDDIISFMKSVLEYAAIDDDKVRVSAVLYRKHATTLFDFNSFPKDAVLDKIDQISFNYRYRPSSPGEGFKHIREQLLTGQLTGNRDEVPDLVILVTDAIPDTDVSAAMDAAQQLKAQGATLFTVGINITYPEDLVGWATKQEFTILVNESKYLASQTIMLQDQFVGLRGEEDPMPLVFPIFEMTTTTPAPTTTTVTTTTTAPFSNDGNLEEMDIVFAIHAGHKSKVKDVKNYLQTFIKDITSNLDVDSGAVRVGLAVYGTDTNVQFDLNTYKKSKKLQKAMKKLKPKLLRSKGSNVVDMLSKVQTEMFIASKGDRPDVANLLVIVTDEKSNADISLLEQQSSSLKNAGTKVLAIGLKDADDSEIEILSSQPKSEYFFTSKNYADLTKSESLKDQLNRIPIFKDFKTSDKSTGKKKKKPKTTVPPVVDGSTQASTKSPIPTEKPKRTKRPKSTKSPKRTRAPPTTMSTTEMVTTPLVTVPTTEFRKILEETSSLPSVDLTDVPLYVVPKVPLSDSNQADIIIALHMSQRASRSHTRNVQAFLKELISNADVASGNVQIGLLMYSADPEIVFRLNQLQDIEEMKREIDSLQPIPSDTIDSSSAVYQVVNMLNPYFNRRKDVPAAAIFVTDEPSTDNLELLEPALRDAAREGISIFSVGIGMRDRSELEQLASDPTYATSVQRYGQVRGETAGLHQKIKALRKFEEMTTTQATRTEIVTTGRVSLADWMKDGDYNLGRTGNFHPGGYDLSSPNRGRNVPANVGNQISSCGSTTFDLAIVLDASTSVQTARWETVLFGVQQLIRDLNIDGGNIRMALVIFSTEATVRFHLNSYSKQRDLIEAVSSTPYVYGRTNTADALKLLHTDVFKTQNGDRPDIPNVAILITDGESNINNGSTIPEANLVRRQGINLYAIGIGLVATAELDGIAGSVSNRYFIDDFDELENKLGAVFKTLCPDVSTLPDLPRLFVPAGECSLGNSDLVIILDASTSVTEKNYKKMLEFTKDLLRNADIDSGAVRVGIVIYSTEVKIQFHLNQYQTKREVLDAIDNIPYPYGSTNTADALRTMHTQMFTPSKGDRPDVDNTCIVVTDGVSNINSRRTIPEAEAARKKNIHIYAVGIGLQDTRELDGIASVPASENSFNVQEFDELQGLDKKIFSAICPEGTNDITTARPEVDKCGLSKVDVVIILDASTSVTQKNFVKMQTFAKDIVQKAKVNSGSVRIGVVIYSTDVRVQFHLNEYADGPQTPTNTTTHQIKAAIDRIPYIYGSTNSADALKTMSTEMFSARNGDRPDADNIAFMITDGVSNINSRRTIPEAESARAKNIKIYAVGIGLQDTRELEGMASKPISENMFNVQEFDELKGLVDTIFGGPDECAVNAPPVANAGRDYTIQLPVDYVALDGRGSSDDVKVVRYQWRQTGGARGGTISNAASSVLEVYDMPAGRYEYTLTVYDEEGLSHDDTVNVVVEPPANEPPVANAGRDIIVQLPDNTATLDGRFSADDNRVVAYQWRQISGPRNIGMGNEESSLLELSRLSAGEYEFSLTVFDQDGLFDEDTVRITVNAPANEAPVANAGRDITVQLPDNTATLDGRSSTDDDRVVAYQWRRISGPRNIGIGNEESSLLELSRLRAGEYEFSLTVFDRDGLSDTDTVRITVSDQDLPPVANAGKDVDIQMPENKVTIDGGSSSDDKAVVSYRWELISGNEAAFYLDGGDRAEATASGMQPGQYTLRLTVTDELGQTDQDEVIINVKAQDPPPRANAGEDITIQYPTDSVSLSGEKSTDNVRIARYQWEVLSGNGGVQWVNSDSPTPSLTQLSPGEYTLRLTVSDNLGQQDSDTMTISVKEPDLPPTANAGRDVTIQSPTDSVTLDGSGSNDDVRIASYLWTVVNGDDSTLNMVGGNTSPTLRARGLKPGQYTFQLEVQDELGQSDIDTVDVTVTATDEPPVARAGDDVTIKLPTNSVTLDGRSSSDDKKIVRYRWRLRSGNKKGVRFTGDRTPVLELSDMKPGSYRFSLLVIDGARQKDTDYVEVTVVEDDPPVAVAGDDQTIQLPNDGLTIYGDRSYDDVRIDRYSWRLVSGNPSVSMDNANTPNLGIRRLQPGSYEFELTVTDESGQQDTDRIEINVLPAPVTTTVGPACGLEKTDLVFVVDASTSVTQDNFVKQLNFMKSIVEYADIDSGSVRIGALIYSTEVEIQFHLNDYNRKADILAAVDKIPYIYGSTNTADGLKTMSETMFSFRNGDRDDAPNVAMVITDGVSNINSRRTVSEAVNARDVGVHIYAIGIGLTDTRELVAMASEPSDENTFAVQDFDELAGLEKRIFTSICIEPEITTPTTTTTTTTPTTTTAITEPSCGLSKTDLVFMLDASTSVTEANFQKMRDFLKDFLRNADINSGSVRVGVNIYSTDVQIRFHLNDYTTEREVYDAIDQIPYIYGSTNTADALNWMAKRMFVRSKGDRPDAPNIAILLTDGISNINSRRTISEAVSARDNDGIQIYVIGIGLQDTREVEGIASKPVSKNLFSIQSFDELKGLDQKIFSNVCPEETQDLPPTANAGRDVYLQLPDNSVRLTGAGSSDDKGIVKYTWTQTRGPRVRVRPTDNQYLDLNALKEGEYAFELEVEDATGQKDTDIVEIYVIPEPDLPPRADAGPDKTIQLPDDSVTLSGSASTDDKGIVEYSWELTSPRNRRVSLRGENSRNVDVNNLEEGEYTFTLTVRDRKGQSDSDSATVYVKAAKDLPPVANAGRDYDIQLPTDTITLDGTSSTDDIGIVSYDWSIISGDSRGVTYRTVDPSRVTLDGLKEGKYVVQLEVTDKKGQTSTDTATINVRRAVRTSGYDVIFILDSSVSPSYFRWMKNYARNVIREMSIDDEEFRVGFMSYSNGAYRQFDLNRYSTKSDVLSAVDSVGYRPGGKNTAEAFKFVRNQMFTKRYGDRDYAKNYIIHLTGGADSRDQFAAATEACRIQNGGTGMFAVGFGEIPNTDELDAYSSLSTSDYRMMMRSENEMGEQPGLMLYQLKNGSPRPSPCPIEVTTTRKPGVCSAQGDIVFILDSSGSVGQENFYRVLNFTYNIIDQLDIDNGDFRVGCETFSDASRLDFHLNEFATKSDLKSALTKVVYMYGNTHTAHALRRARTEMFTLENGDRPDIPNIAVIVTDGQSNVNHELTIPEANSLKSSGASIITVAVGFTSETSELDGITSPPTSDNLYYVTDYKSLEKVKAKLIDILCSDSNMCRNNPCQNGGTCHDGVRSFHCRCPPEYFGETCDKRCGEPADVVIVLDSSDTVGRYNFGRLKEYAEHLVRQMNKDSCNINLGFMKYSSAAMVQVSLGMHTDTETNIRALDQISYSRGRANMAAALRALRTRMFNGGRGDRPNAKNVAYFLTDGTNDVMADRTEPEAELTISSGVRIIPIGVNLRERYELDNIAQNQGINVIEIDDEPGLIENTDVILRPLYQGNDFCTEKPCSNGGLCINEPFGYKCDCPVGYTGDTCQKRCSSKGDVVFAVDTSRYVTRSELKKVRRFLRSIVKRMNFKRNQFSVGMVQFTDWAKVILDFNEGQSKKAVRSSIAGLRVHGGDPEPATALAKANYRIFNAGGASRDKPDYLVLITKSMRNEVEVLNEASKLKLQGTQVLGVGIGLSDNEKEYLQSAVSLPAAKTAIFADDVKTLNDIGDQIVEFMCAEDDVCAQSPCQNGGTCQRHGGDYFCECTVGYAGKHCENRCKARADIIFLLDSSGSVGYEDFRQVKQFVHNMVGDLQIGKDKTRVGLTTYSSNTRHGFYMSQYFDLFKLQSAIAGINYEYGNTNTAAGLKLVRERYFSDRHGNRPDIQDFLVVITDGVSNVDPDQTLVEAQLLKDMGVHVYAVGIGQFDPYEINNIASEPATMNAFILQDYSDLKNISSSIIKATCRDPTVCDENPCQNGGLCVPGINGAFCECRAGFRGVHCEDSCVVVKDIFFLVDSSDSVGANNFKTALNFVSTIVEEFSTKNSHNRFSLITFGSEVQIVFSLGRYTSLPILKSAINNARYRPGNTNTAGALRTVQEISSSSLGDRYDAENIVFMLVDGNGNINENDTLLAAEELKDGGARIITLAMNMQDYSEVSQMASGEQDVFRVNTYSSLPTILEDIILTTCKNGNEILG